MAREWILDQTDSERFPYLRTIPELEEIRQQLLVQDSWPAEGKNTFCLRPKSRSVSCRSSASTSSAPISRIGAKPGCAIS